MNSARIAKRWFGGTLILVGLAWFVLSPNSWATLKTAQLGYLIYVVYVSVGMGCMLTGALILRLTRQRLATTALGVGFIWALAAAPSWAALTQVRTFAALVSEVPEDSVRVDLSRTHWLLQRLRVGDTNGAIERLEGDLQSGIVRLEMVPEAARKTNTLRVLERARAYRAAYPRPVARAATENRDNSVAMVDAQKRP